MSLFETILITGALFITAVILGVGCVATGAWIAYKVRRRPGDPGLFRDPKGDAFTLPDDSDIQGFQEIEEPGESEKRILKQANRFLSALDGGKTMGGE